MADVQGGSGKDFFHPAGDGLIAPGGYNDITYNPGDNVFGFQDDDIFIGGRGVYVGYGGYDILDYSYYSQGVVLSDDSYGGYGRILHHNGAVIGHYWLGLPPDLGTGFEEFRGTAYGDVLVSGLETFRLLGQGGDDTLVGGMNDETLDGGAGLDTVSYLSSVSAVAVDLNLAGPQASGGAASDDVLIGVENLIGSLFGDRLTGDSGANAIAGGDGGDILDGGGGVDTADYTSSSAGVTVSLLLGTGLGGHADGDTLANFENVRGSAYNDTLAGDAGSNRLEGAGGSDVLIGLGGPDTMIGGAGADTADYAQSPSGVVVSLTTGAGSGGDAHGDILSEVENLIGSFTADILTGDAGANRLHGNGGNDILAGLDGADTLDGASGIDWASYSASTVAVSVNLAAGTASGGHAEGDVLSSIENLAGSVFADTLTGSTAANVLDGGSGNDVMAGGAGGDTLAGGAGDDTADYAASGAGVAVNLSDATASGGDATGDILMGVENLTGSGHADSLTGAAGANQLAGGDGDDVLAGLDGADTLMGGGGVDAADYSASAAAVTIDLAAGTGLGGDAQGDVLAAIENLIGSDGDDSLAGSTAANRLAGGAGGDSLAGGGGDDLFAGAAADLAGDRIADFGIGDRILVDDATAGLRASLVGDQLTIWADGTGPGVVMTLANRPAGTTLVVDATTKTISLAAAPSPEDAVVIGGSEAGDLIKGNHLDNRIYAGGSEDVVYGGPGADTIDAGAGDDFAQGNAGADLILAGPGADTALGGQDNDRIEGGDGGDRLFGDLGDDVLFGDLGDDVLQGNGGADRLEGGDGADQLLGGQNGDVLAGGAGDDLLSGDLGDDALSGGAGADVFLHARGGGQDVISDFSAADHDVVRLIGLGVGSFAELSGRISAAGSDTLISFDDGGAIRLTGVAASSLTADSFAFG